MYTTASATGHHLQYFFKCYYNWIHFFNIQYITWIFYYYSIQIISRKATSIIMLLHINTYHLHAPSPNLVEHFLESRKLHKSTSRGLEKSRHLCAFDRKFCLLQDPMFILYWYHTYISLNISGVSFLII